MTAIQSDSDIKKYIDIVAGRLPATILYEGVVHKLDIKYFGGLDNFWTLSYTAGASVFIHRDEATLEACVLGAWRNLALKKDQWDFTK